MARLVAVLFDPSPQSHDGGVREPRNARRNVEAVVVGFGLEDGGNMQRCRARVGVGGQAAIGGRRGIAGNDDGVGRAHEVTVRPGAILMVIQAPVLGGAAVNDRRAKRAARHLDLEAHANREVRRLRFEPEQPFSHQVEIEGIGGDIERRRFLNVNRGESTGRNIRRQRIPAGPKPAHTIIHGVAVLG